MNPVNRILYDKSKNRIPSEKEIINEWNNADYGYRGAMLDQININNQTREFLILKKWNEIPIKYKKVLINTLKNIGWE
jgi:hypothetical protein